MVCYICILCFCSDPFEVREELAAQEELEAATTTQTASGETKSRSASISSSSDISYDPQGFQSSGDSTPPLDSEPADVMSIYDMAPPPFLEERSLEDEAEHLSVIEAMNKRNESPAKSAKQPQISDSEETAPGANRNIDFAADTTLLQDSTSQSDNYPGHGDDVTSDLNGASAVAEKSGQIITEAITESNSSSEPLSLPISQEESFNGKTGNTFKNVGEDVQHIPSVDLVTVKEYQDDKNVIEETINNEMQEDDKRKPTVNDNQERPLETAVLCISDGFSAESGMHLEDTTNLDSRFSNENRQTSKTN